MSRTTRLRRSAGVLAVAASAAALPAAAHAGTVPVSSGSLAWTQTNVYTQPSTKTWLGYVTGDPMTGLAGGSATPIAPATGPTVDTASDRGADKQYTTTFPATSGTYDADNGTGAIELDGGLSYTSPVHMFTITVEKPQVVLDGLSGKLYASGKNGNTPSAPYDRSQAVFNLDLSGATVTLKADGSRVIGPIVPSIAVTKYAFPSQYPAGAGPDRTPNTFGSFSLTVKAPGGNQGAKGDKGDKGDAGAPGAAGTSVTATIRSVVAHLAKAPYAGTKSRKVTVYNAKNKKLATGTIKGRTLKVTLADKVTSLPSSVKLKVTGAKASKSVRIPS